MTVLQNPNTVAATAAVHDTHASRDSGGSARAAPRGLLALLIAGSLLQRRGHRIAVEPGERYPSAVRRFVGALPPEQRQTLRGEVRFLLTTDLRYGPFSALAKYQTGDATKLRR